MHRYRSNIRKLELSLKGNPFGKTRTSLPSSLQRDRSLDLENFTAIAGHQIRYRPSKHLKSTRNKNPSLLTDRISSPTHPSKVGDTVVLVLGHACATGLAWLGFAQHSTALQQPLEMYDSTSLLRMSCRYEKTQECSEALGGPGT